jgi:hypothetical protein
MDEWLSIMYILITSFIFILFQQANTYHRQESEYALVIKGEYVCIHFTYVYNRIL